MDRLWLIALCGAICLSGAAAYAQSASGDRARLSTIPRAGPGYTNGWSLMTDEERHDYRAKITAMLNAGACRAFVEQHHRDMVTRAKETNASLPPPARLDVCDGLPP